MYVFHINQSENVVVARRLRFPSTFLSGRHFGSDHFIINVIVQHGTRYILHFVSTVIIAREIIGKRISHVRNAGLKLVSFTDGPVGYEFWCAAPQLCSLIS